MLQVNDLSVRYPGQKFLFENLSFTLGQGETLWLKAPNGSGKTTLLYALSNVIPISIVADRSGEVLLDNVLLNDVPLPNLLPVLSLMLCNPGWELFFTFPEEEIIFALENLNLSEAEIGDRLNSICSDFALEQWMQTPVHKLSAGWQKMVVLAAHCAVKPRVLLLDEPFNGLSDVNAARVMSWLKNYLRDGGSLIIAEHSPRIEQLNPTLLELGKHQCQ
ncbi:MAG: ABC transporter ATP-binding protein [Candidatus Cloacimonadaceae bacterium]